MLTDLLTVAVLAFIGSRLVRAARVALRPESRRHVAFLVRGLRLRHFLRAPFVFAAVVVAILLLYQIPPLRFGWWTAIGGTGNVVTGTTDRTAGTAFEYIIPIAFLLLLAPALPLFAQREEELFRLGAEDWSNGRRLTRGLQFGLVHLIMGIPIAAALALSIGGWYFTWAYLGAYRRSRGDRREALMESTRSHLAYNVEILGVAFVAVVISAVLAACGSSSSSASSKSPSTSGPRLTVTSPAFADGATIPSRFTCTGDNLSPPLAWSDPPSGTAGFALVVADPDAPNGTFVHWVVAGLDPGRRTLAENERPPGATEGKNTAGSPGYTGPCPPPGKPHHYRFTVYAVRQPPTSSTPAAIERVALASGTLTGMFGR